MIYKGARDLFPTKIWGFEFENPDDLKPYTDHLYNMAHTQGEGRVGGKDAFYYTEGSWQSNNLVENELFKPLFVELGHNIIEAMLKDGTDRPINSLKFKEAWGNINPPNTQIKEHLHIGSDYSGVLYLQTSKNCGNISFRDPRIHYEMIYQTANEYVEAADGRVIVFPAWLRHEIDINH